MGIININVTFYYITFYLTFHCQLTDWAPEAGFLLHDIHKCIKTQYNNTTYMINISYLVCCLIFKKIASQFLHILWQ